jgi:metallo-beta-lactamase family protein
MKIHYFGAARTTTGSMYLIEVNGKKLLLECGLFQGHREESIQRNCCFPFDPRQIDTVILSHAHMDHAGNLPNLCKQGYRGNIHCTFATRDLCSVMLVDSGHIQEADAQFVSKERAKKGQPPVQPLYTVADAEKTLDLFIAVGYERPILVADGVTVTFRDAGHILGSAQVIFDVQEKGRKFRYLFSGDVGRGGDEILRDPAPTEGVDFLQIESTYGGREHEPRTNADEIICKHVLDTLNQHGKVIIPAFSVGRTQQIVYVLNQLTLAGRLPRAPIFVDSPLSVNVTEIYRLHPECFNETIYRFLHEKANPFGMTNLTYIREAEHSKKLNDIKEACVIISASGMCEAGRVRHHLKNNISFANNLVIFIGYCAESTLGRAIQEGKNPVNIFGEPVEVKAKIVSLDTYSGHADKNELRAYVQRIGGNLKRIICVHGEEDQCLAHAETLRDMKPNAQVIVPEYKQIVEL